MNISSGAAPGCVKNCSPERKALLTNPNVTWEELDALIQEIEVLPNAGSSLKDAGIGDVRGAYGLSKAILNAFTMLTAREHPRLAVNSCSPGMVNTDIIKVSSDCKPFVACKPFMFVRRCSGSCSGLLFRLDISLIFRTRILCRGGCRGWW